MRWVEDKTETLARELHAGRLDAALLALEADLGGPLQREVIGRDPFVLAAPRKHPLAQADRARRDLGELRGAHLLLLDDGHCLRDQALAVCARARTEELGVPRDQPADAGADGVGRRRRHAAARAWRSRPRAAAPTSPSARIADDRAFRTLALVWRPTSPSGPALRQLAATIRASYEKMTLSRSP